MDIWNELIKIRDRVGNSTAVRDSVKKRNHSISHHASMLLRQCNTAGGMIIMRGEAETFINRHKK